MRRKPRRLRSQRARSRERELRRWLRQAMRANDAAEAAHLSARALAAKAPEAAHRGSTPRSKRKWRGYRFGSLAEHSVPMPALRSQR